MARPCITRWLPYMLAAAVVVPFTSFLGFMVYGVHTEDNGWEEASGPGLMGFFLMPVILVPIAALSCRAAVRREVESYLTLTAVFGLIAGLFTIALIEFAAVWTGFQEGQVSARGLAFVAGIWGYCLLICLGYWYLHRGGRTQ